MNVCALEEIFAAFDSKSCLKPWCEEIVHLDPLCGSNPYIETRKGDPAGGSGPSAV